MSLEIQDLPIRLLQPEDRPLVREFFAQMSEESTRFINCNRHNEKAAIEYLKGRRQRFCYWIATEPTPDGEQIAGLVFLMQLHTALPTLGVAVRESRKGHRLGQRLIEFARDELQSKGYGGILLTTAQDNLRAQRLYERLGFAEIGTYPNGEKLYLLPFPHDHQCPIPPKKPAE